jgi:hypothetical protein
MRSTLTQRAQYGHPFALRNAEMALQRVISRALGWFLPTSAENELSGARRNPEEIAALENQIRKFTEQHRFTGFPC